MDVFSHSVWGATIIRKSPLVCWAALFGALPDIIPFVYGVVRFKKAYAKRLRKMGRDEHSSDSYFRVYHFCHSLVPITIVTVIIYYTVPSYWYITIPYYFHIIMDIITHQRIWATRIFYPFSDFHFQFGKNWWQNHWISAVNWGVLIGVNIIIFTNAI